MIQLVPKTAWCTLESDREVLHWKSTCKKLDSKLTSLCHTDICVIKSPSTIQICIRYYILHLKLLEGFISCVSSIHLIFIAHSHTVASHMMEWSPVWWHHHLTSFIIKGLQDLLCIIHTFHILWSLLHLYIKYPAMERLFDCFIAGIIVMGLVASWQWWDWWCLHYNVDHILMEIHLRHFSPQPLPW